VKLYYSAGSCSTSCHITLEESGLKYEAIEVDWDNASDPNVALATKLNPLGTLPILITDEGKQLDQNVAIHVHVADRGTNKALLPPAGTIERAEALNWLAFVTSDLHKSIGALFGLQSISQDAAVQGVVRKYMVEKANEYLRYMDSKLAGKDYLMGKTFTPADAYAFVVTGWTKWLEIPLTPYSNIQSYMTRVASRPAVAKVLKAEGLLE
jgi:glutathione S-transferase